MNNLQLKVIKELEKNYGWSDIIDDVSIGVELFKDTVQATESVIKNLNIPDVNNSTEIIEKIVSGLLPSNEEIREPIQNAIYATERFTTDQCTEFADGILTYLNEA